MQAVWERERREKGNALTVLLATWIKIHKQGEGQVERASPSNRSDTTKPKERHFSDGEYSGSEERSTGTSGVQDDSEDSTDGEDIVEDFRMSSEESSD